MTTIDQDQLNRIERKLDQVLEFRDMILKLALPRVPAGMREQAARLAAGIKGGG